MGLSASSSKQIINKNVDAQTKPDNVDHLLFKENADAPNYNEKQNAANSSTATNFASVSEPLHVKSTSHLSCPLFLYAMPNMTVIPYSILPSNNSDGLVQPSSITTATTILFPMLDNTYPHMGACDNVTFDSSKCVMKESKMMVNNKNNINNNNNSGNTASISLILANEIANTHYQTNSLSDISALLDVINGNKFAQQYGVCYLINYSVGDDGKVVGVQNVNNVGKKGQAAVKCGRGFNLHSNINTSCTRGKDFSDIASVSSSCNFSLREPSVLSVISDKLDLESEADMCSRSFTSTVKVLDEANVVEHEDHEPIIGIPTDLVVKSVLVQESTIKDKEPPSSHTLLRRRSSRILKKKEREQTLASSHTYCRTRYCVFNDSIEYEAHISIGLLNNIGMLSVENDEANKASGLRVLCKPTVHVDDPLIRPGQSKKVGYNHNVICSDHSVWCYIEVNSHNGKKIDEINNSDKLTKSSIREKKSKVCISEVNTVSNNNIKVNNNEDNNNKTNSNHFAVKNGHSEFYSWKDALLGHATSTEINTFTTYLNELERLIDCNVQRNWNEIYIVLAPGASVMVFEGVVNAFFMHVQQIPFNEKVSLAKWGKYYTEEEIKTKKQDIQTLFAKERLKPKEKRKGKINAHTLLYALSISPENTHITSDNLYSTHTQEPVNVDATNTKVNENASEAIVTNDLRLNSLNVYLKEEERPANCINSNTKSENDNINNINNREYGNIDTSYSRKADFDEDAVEVFVTPESKACNNTHDKGTKSRELSNNYSDNAQFRQLSKQENKESKLDNNCCNNINKNGYYNKNNYEVSKSDAEEMSSGRANHHNTSAKKKLLKPMKMLDNYIPLSESEGNTCKIKEENLFRQEIEFEEYSPYVQEQAQEEKVGEQTHAEDYNADRPLNFKVISHISFDEAYDGSSIVF